MKISDLIELYRNGSLSAQNKINVLCTGAGQKNERPGSTRGGAQETSDVGIPGYYNGNVSRLLAFHRQFAVRSNQFYVTGVSFEQCEVLLWFSVADFSLSRSKWRPGPGPFSVWSWHQELLVSRQIVNKIDFRSIPLINPG